MFFKNALGLGGGDKPPNDESGQPPLPNSADDPDDKRLSKRLMDKAEEMKDKMKDKTDELKDKAKLVRCAASSLWG